MYELDAPTLIFSLLLTWGIGLTPPLLIRYLLLKRPIGTGAACGICGAFWLFNLLLSTALGSKSKTHGALVLVAMVSYWILRKASSVPDKERMALTPMHQGTRSESAVVEKAPDAIRKVLGDEFALLALERWIGSEVNALLDAERIGGAVIRDVRHRGRDARHEFRRPCKIIVGQQRIEHCFHDEYGILVRLARRIEARFRDAEGVTDDFLRIRRAGMGHPHENSEQQCKK